MFACCDLCLLLIMADKNAINCGALELHLLTLRIEKNLNSTVFVYDIAGC